MKLFDFVERNSWCSIYFWNEKTKKREGNYSTGMTRLNVCLYELSVEIIERIIDYNVWCRNKSFISSSSLEKISLIVDKTNRLEFNLIKKSFWSSSPFDYNPETILSMKLVNNDQTPNQKHDSFRNARISSTSLFNIEQYSLKWITKDSSSSPTPTGCFFFPSSFIFSWRKNLFRI